MICARILCSLLFAAALAACSENLGGGSTMPGTAANNGVPLQQVTPVPGATATPIPVSASNVATIGDNVDPQALPNVMGWGGSIAFLKAMSSTSPVSNPKRSQASDTTSPNSISIGITTSVVEPSDTPHFNLTSSKRHAKHESRPTALLFISVMATSDLALAKYPKIALDVPHDIVIKHRNDTFALALFDPEQKVRAYRLAIAERDLSSPAPGSRPTPIPTSTPTPVPTASPTTTPFGTSLTLPQMTTPKPVSTLPPEYVAFQATAATLMLKADRPVVFALYAITPYATPSPSPEVSPGGSPTSAAKSTPSIPAIAPPLSSSTSSPQATSKPIVVI
jgi:hypothetical protein